MTELLVDNSDARFTGHAAPVFSVSIHPAGELAVSGGEDDCAFVWRISDGSLVHTLEKHLDSVVCTGFNRDGKLVAIGSMDGIIKVYKVCFLCVLMFYHMTCIVMVCRFVCCSIAWLTREFLTLVVARTHAIQLCVCVCMCGSGCSAHPYVRTSASHLPLAHTCQVEDGTKVCELDCGDDLNWFEWHPVAQFILAGTGSGSM